MAFSILLALVLYCAVECRPPLPYSSEADTTLHRQSQNQWFKDGKSKIEEILGQPTYNKKAKGVILFIGDGMGISTVTAARIYDGQLKGMTGEENVLSWEKFPNVGLSKTYNTDSQVSDSAGTATAYWTGVKARRGVVGVDESVHYRDCDGSKDHDLKSLLMIAEMQGLSTGVVTTTRVTDASPAATYASSAARRWESEAPAGCKDIASQAIDFTVGDGLEVLMGGGREKFHPTTSEDPEYKEQGERVDGRNLIDEWQAKTKPGNKYEYIWNKDQFNKMKPEDVDHVLALFEPSHMLYEHEKGQYGAGEPTLPEMVEFAVKVLEKNPKGYILFVEGGKIDKSHHSNKPIRALNEAVMLGKAVEKVDQMTNEDEVTMLVSADHSHGFSISGYPKRGNPIEGLSGYVGKDGMEYTTLSYATGPGGNRYGDGRRDPEDFDFKDYEQRYNALVPLSSAAHSGEDVGIYARGPQAHLVRGVIEQNVIFHIMDYALCLSKEAKQQCLKHRVPGA